MKSLIHRHRTTHTVDIKGDIHDYEHRADDDALYTTTKDRVRYDGERLVHYHIS